jgi:hypothetical protein
MQKARKEFGEAGHVAFRGGSYPEQESAILSPGKRR